MEKSLKIRKAKAKARALDEKRSRKGRLDKREVCLAAGIDPRWLKGPLILDKVHAPDLEAEDA